MGYTKIEAENIVNQMNRDVFGRNMFDTAYNQINRSEQQGLSSLNKSYDQEILNAYGSMLGADAGVRKSNVFSGYKDYMIDENQKNFETTMANAYNTYLQNRATLEENAAKSRQKIDDLYASQLNLVEQGFELLPEYLQSFVEKYDSWSDEEKRNFLGEQYQVKQGDKYKKNIPGLLEYLAENPQYAPFITRNENGEYQWADIDLLHEEMIANGTSQEDIDAMYRQLYNVNDKYSFDDFLYEKHKDVYDKFSEQNPFGLGINKSLFEKTYGGNKPLTSQEAFEKFDQTKLQNTYNDIAESVDKSMSKKYKNRSKEWDRDTFHGEKLIGSNNEKLDLYEKKLVEQGIDTEFLDDVRNELNKLTDEFKTYDDIVQKASRNNFIGSVKNREDSEYSNYLISIKPYIDDDKIISLMNGVLDGKINNVSAVSTLNVLLNDYAYNKRYSLYGQMQTYLDNTFNKK